MKYFFLNRNVHFGQSGEAKKATKPQEGVKLYEAIVQLLGELQQMPGMDGDAAFLSHVELLGKIFKTFRCYYMALTCQGNRQWAEALALYQRAEVRCTPPTFYTICCFVWVTIRELSLGL